MWRRAAGATDSPFPQDLRLFTFDFAGVGNAGLGGFLYVGGTKVRSRAVDSKTSAARGNHFR